MSEKKKLTIKSTRKGEKKKLTIKSPSQKKGLKIKKSSLPELNETPEPQRKLLLKKGPTQEQDTAQHYDAQPQPVEYQPQPQPVEYQPQPQPVEYQPQPQPVEYQPQPQPVEYQQQPQPVEYQQQPQPVEYQQQPQPVEYQQQPQPVEYQPQQGFPTQQPQQGFPTQQPQQGYQAQQGFPTQQPQQGYPVQQPVNHYHEATLNPQGPIFPTSQPSPSGQRPPGTMPPPTHQKKTSAPLSAIMGEVKAAKKINFDQTHAAQNHPQVAPQGHFVAQQQVQQQQQQVQQQVVKMKKPAISIKDKFGTEYCLIKNGHYYVGLENELIEVKAPFTLGKFPVTKADYFSFLKETGIEYSSEELNIINKVSPYANCPAVMVSWENGKDYCRWLREKTGDYYALPSISEWEAAARGTDGRIYPWGEVEPTSETTCFNDGIMIPQSTASVDYFMENISPSGCVGMVGNIMEWTLNSFDDDREPHILKGGSWESPIDFCNNVTPCMSFPPNKRQEFVGLRLLFLPQELYQSYKDAYLQQ